MKTLIDWAIQCGNENEIGFTNEPIFPTGNEDITTICTGNERGNEHSTSHPFENENLVEMNGYITTKQSKNERGNEPTLHTKWGTAKINPNSGYYTITGGKYKNKLLHRLMFEEFYGFIPPNHVIHHKNSDKLCNCILNLQLMSFKNHLLHHYERGDFTNKDVYYCLKESKAQNTTGYFRVSKSKCKQCKQGFIYRYQYYENNLKKALFSTTLERLEEKVKDKGLPWRELQ